jgi:heme exporter protein B
MWREIRLVAGKDLRIEARSRVASGQIAPFAVMVLVLFGFALEGDSVTLRRFTGGLFWVTVLFAAILAVQRGFGIETDNDNREALRLSGLEPPAVFFGKVLAIGAELVALEAVLGAGVAVLYRPHVEKVGLLVPSALLATLALTAAGTLYGVLAASLRARETILPLLLLPVLAPVLLAATRAFEDALGVSAVNGWSWLALLGLLAVVYVALGALAFGALLEDG